MLPTEILSHIYFYKAKLKDEKKNNYEFDYIMNKNTYLTR